MKITHRTKQIAGISVTALLMLAATQAYCSGIDLSGIKKEISLHISFQRYFLNSITMPSGKETGLGAQSIVMQKERVKAEKISHYIKEAAEKHNLPVSLIRAVIKAESDFKHESISHKGCIGLMQLHPGTAAEFNVNPWDIRQNILGGAAYIRWLYDRYGSVEEALWGFNAGPSKADKAIMPGETREYIDNVMRYWGMYSGGS